MHSEKRNNTLTELNNPVISLQKELSLNIRTYTGNTHTLPTKKDKQTNKQTNNQRKQTSFHNCLHPLPVLFSLIFLFNYSFLTPSP